MDPDSIRKKFLDDNAEFLLDEFSRVLKGDADEFSCKSNVNLGRAMSLLETIILSADDKVHKKMENIAEIVEGVKTGTISPNQADKLLDALKTAAEVEDMELNILLKSRMVNLLGEPEED